MRLRRRQRLGTVVGVALLVVGLAGCSEDANSIAAQAKDGSRKGYISGNGAIEQIPRDQRAAPVTLSGETLTGDAWSVAGAAGDVVVVNVWASWCGPCQQEAPDLQRTWQSFSSGDQPVQFMGINTRDNPSSGIATAKKHGLTYPSLNDPSGLLILGLQGKVSAPPTTLVLDKTGRIAARVNGRVSATTLTGLVDDVLTKG